MMALVTLCVVRHISGSHYGLLAKTPDELDPAYDYMEIRMDSSVLDSLKMQTRPNAFNYSKYKSLAEAIWHEAYEGEHASVILHNIPEEPRPSCTIL